jgi:putative spermidine/putrescine transport system permease protein
MAPADADDVLGRRLQFRRPAARVRVPGDAGRTGIVTTLLITLFDFNIYSTGFNLLSFWGLTLTYLYFQIPLMVLIITPALTA